ncbi:MAG: response regulator [Defluviitaleaceae bacterium]|nr:response regulator [Defluviitaleaceae bacterium]
MLKKIREMNVAKKLLVSFAIIIAMFFSVAVYSNVVIRNMDYLYRYRIHNMEARNVLLLELHQELTEFRRLLKASYYNPVWIDTAGDTVRRRYEIYITESHSRMGDLARLYIESVSGDSIFDEHLEYYANYYLVARMEYIKGFADEVFNTFHNNFFIGGNDSRYKGDVLDITPAIEDSIRYLRDVDSRVDASIQSEIESALALNQTITVATLAITITFSLALAWFTFKSLAKWVKNIEDAAIRSLQESTVAEANSQAKSRFLARMSHEIRTPVSAVIGISEIQLQKTDLPKDVQDAFSRVYTSSSALIGILNDILDLSKIEAGKMDIFMAEYDVPSLIQDVLQMHVVALDSKKFKLIVNVDETLPAALIGDVLRLKQVLNNIMSNAFKYTELGVVEFSIRNVGHPGPGTINMVVEIRDTGKGMTKEQVETILREEYVRFHEKDNPKVVGTGLGMPIVLNLLELMDAHIDIESHVQAGTKVILQIPQKVASAESIGKKTAQSLSNLEAVNRKPAFTPVSLPHGKVLVVDDVETNLFVAKGLFGLYDLQIETCNNAPDAINKVKCGAKYDIIFMDHMMPELNGMDATKILRDLGYTSPVVALTANALIGQAEEFLAGGFDEFIAKPIQTTHLHHIIMKYIGNKRENTPDVSSNTASTDGYYDTPEVKEMLREEFKSTQQTAMEEIKDAIAKGDKATARRLSHTIKGMAHMMKETNLALSAEAVESAIYNGKEITDTLIQTLEQEIEAVLVAI